MNKLFLKKGREKSLLRKHPWIFSGAVLRVEGNPKAGEVVDVCEAGGNWVARASFSPRSQIRGRVLSFERNRTVDRDLIRELLAAAIERRLGTLGLPESMKDLAGEQKIGVRLVNAESDYLPGLVVDFYSGYLVTQFTSVGIEFWRKDIVESLKELVPCKGIYDRSDVGVRSKEGLAETTGTAWGSAPPQFIEINEESGSFLVDIKAGHKTGFYLDQRANRNAVKQASKGCRVLNCFSYSGGFGVAAANGGAVRVLNLDASAPALELAAKNYALNPVPAGGVDYECGNAFDLLKKYAEAEDRFDLIVLDPPKMADSQANIKSACRGYQYLNRLAFQLLAKKGMLFTFSCSGLVGRDLFNKVVADAALDAGRRGNIVSRLGQDQDHPVALPFPEGEYLKGLAVRVD